MLTNVFRRINLETGLFITIQVLMLVSYSVFPLWKTIESYLLASLFVLATALLIPQLIRKLLCSILNGYSPIVNLISSFKNHFAGLAYFVVTFLFFAVILNPLLSAPLLPRGDEPAHIGRVVYTTWTATLGGRISSLLVGVAIVLAVLVGFMFFAFLSSDLEQDSFLEKVLRFLPSWLLKALSYSIMGVGLLFLVYGFLDWSITVDFLTRFGPLHPLLFSLPHMLFGYADLTIFIWRMMNLGLMVGAATLIGRITHELLGELDVNGRLDSKVKNSLTALAGWIFLSYPVTIDYSTQIYLAAGVAFLFVLNCFFLIRLLLSDNAKSRALYLVFLAVSMGISCLWKRVLLVQAGAIFLILLFSIPRKQNKSTIAGLLEWLKALTVFSLIFGPWILVVQLQGLVSRPYEVDLTYLLPPHILDYPLRFEIQMGFFLGIIGYSSLAIITLIGIKRKQKGMLTLLPLFLSWLAFFTLDDCWAHNVDRFFVPVLSVMSVSTSLVIAFLICSFPPRQSLISNMGITAHREKKWREIVKCNKTGLSGLAFTFILLPSMLGLSANLAIIPQIIDDRLDSSYIPYEETAQYIHSLLEGDSGRLWSRWGPSSLSFYLNKFGDYGISTSGYGASWHPDPGNRTTINFVSFLNLSGYSVVAIPNPRIARGDLIPASIIEDLRIRYQDLGFDDMRTFSYGSNEFHVWSL